MKNGIEVLFDCDDILIDTTTHWLDTIYKNYGIRKNIDDIKDWDIVKPFMNEVESNIITVEQIKDTITKEHFWDTISRIESVLEIIRNLKERYKDKSVNFKILTAQYYYIPGNKIPKVIDLYDGLFHWSDVIISSHKGLIRGDILVDDNFKNCVDFINGNPGSVALMRKRPYNITQFNEYNSDNNNIEAFSTMDELLSVLIATIDRKLGELK